MSPADLQYIVCVAHAAAGAADAGAAAVIDAI